MRVRLTPEFIARACKENLTQAEIDFVIRMGATRPGLLAVASSRGPYHFATEAEIAKWWLAVCQDAHINPGSS